MPAKVVLILCSQALLIQTAFSQCIGREAIAAPTLIAPGCAGHGWAGNGWMEHGLIANGCAGNWANNGLISNGLTALEVIPTTGGGLPVSSVSAIAPSGLSIESENVFEGALSVGGDLPFVSAVALEGVLPTAGAGAVSYSCGNGVTAIESITPSDAAAVVAGLDVYGLSAGYERGTAAFAPAALGLGYGSRVCGCGAYQDFI